MKSPFILILLCPWSLFARAAEPMLSSAQVVTIAKTIARDKDYGVVNDYDLEHPTYSKGEKSWYFQYKKDRGGFVEAALPVFEIRDSDGYFLLGSLTSNSKGPEFRMPPKFRKQISLIVKEEK